MEKRRKRFPSGLRGAISALAVFFAAVAIFAALTQNAEKRVAGEEVRTLREALVKAAVGCYATEGRYPPSLEYLKENYGVIVDGARYRVVYDAFAENLMPAISVYEIGGN